MRARFYRVNDAQFDCCISRRNERITKLIKEVNMAKGVNLYKPGGRRKKKFVLTCETTEFGRFPESGDGVAYGWCHDGSTVYLGIKGDFDPEQVWRYLNIHRLIFVEEIPMLPTPNFLDDLLLYAKDEFKDSRRLREHERIEDNTDYDSRQRDEPIPSSHTLLHSL